MVGEGGTLAKCDTLTSSPERTNERAKETFVPTLPEAISDIYRPTASQNKLTPPEKHLTLTLFKQLTTVTFPLSLSLSWALSLSDWACALASAEISTKGCQTIGRQCRCPKVAKLYCLRQPEKRKTVELKN